MPRSPQHNEQIRTARRAEILAAAATVFAAKGVARTKISDIAAAAKLSHGLLYHYFPSKEAIFEAIAQDMVQRAEADLASPHARAIDRLTHTLVQAHARLCDETIDASRVVILAVLLRDCISPSLHERLSAHLVRLVERTRDTIAQAQAEGDIDPTVPADDVARLILFLYRGMAIRVPNSPVPLPSPHTLLRLLAPPAQDAESLRQTQTS